MAKTATTYLKSIPKAVANATADLLDNSDFISRTIGMSNSYEDIMFIVQSLGREPISLLGKDYVFIFDHVRRNYKQGTEYTNEYGCPKFTFYKEPPTVRFADVDLDPLSLKDKWVPNMTFSNNISERVGLYYAESNDDETNNKVVYDSNANLGVSHGQIAQSFDNLSSCDIIKKTNDNFNHGKYRTLIARFHTNSEESKGPNDTTQTAYSKRYGLSHGRNLLKLTPKDENGYDNPYCRVWTYHHQYNSISRAIRPFNDASTHEQLEEKEGNGVSFRTLASNTYDIDGGSKRLDKYGVLNENGFVNIAPTAKIKDYFEGKQDDSERRTVSPKRTMFSIENLAWKDSKNNNKEFDAYGLSAEQLGPLGGRIMWFPPYNLKFSEDVTANWNPSDFIGRGEKVYTYVNTERRGNLAFTLLIDHPSILDYWSGHERNGMTNQGVELLPLNTDGVDEKYNQENTLLRFFAGCEILTAKPQEYNMRNAKPSSLQVSPNQDGNGENSDKDANSAATVIENDTPNTDYNSTNGGTIVCVLYYPNNYSGKDDAPQKGGIVNAINYLMNGIGTQKYVNEATKSAEDFEVDIINKLYNEQKALSGGYEVRGSSISGISLALTKLDADKETIDKSYAYSSDTSNNTQYLTEGDGETFSVKYGQNGETKILAKQIGSKAMPLANAVGDNVSKAPYVWYRKRWYYRVDKDTENQDLTTPNNYLDKNSYGLNGSSGYESVKSNKSIMNSFGITDDMHLVSFCDMFVALEGNPSVENVMSGAFDVDNVNLIKEIKENPEKYKISEVKFYGHASSQGNNPISAVNQSRNDSLSKNRALTFKKWMESKWANAVSSANTEMLYGVQEGGNKYDVDDKITKMWRSASVVIKYTKEDVNIAQTTDKDYETVEVNGNEVITSKSELVSQLNPEARERLAEWVQDYNYTHSEQERINSIEELMQSDELKKKLGEDEGVTSTNSESNDNDGLNQGSSVGKSTVKRYDNEGEFFELLDKESPFLHNLITEKIRYFDPAYHSVSPEGFNARLTFLHQCTRQGSTVGASDANRLNAYNLAFGRPPVCVLRIGDFFNTKIVITSLNIQYDSPQWDMNLEGIGVMPMFADITLNFYFIGGSDLSGPISRLQNAVSFNYYANTSVYDNRAERVEYETNASGKETKFKPFIYPNGIGSQAFSTDSKGNVSKNAYDGRQVYDKKNKTWINVNSNLEDI